MSKKPEFDALGIPVTGSFEEWMTQGDTPTRLLQRIQRKFVLGGHKAAAIALVSRRARVFLVSPVMGDVPAAGIEHHATVDTALDAAFEAMGPARGEGACVA